jgi:hypothetical protein
MENTTEKFGSSRCVRFVRFFLLSSAWILIVTGLAKLWASFGPAKILLLNDPVLGIQSRVLMGSVGVSELVVACFCFFDKRVKRSLVLVAWLATNIAIYRVALASIGYQKPCSCLGNITDALHLSPHAADTIAKLILAYLFVGSSAALCWLWWQSRRGVHPFDLAGPLGRKNQLGAP